MFMVPRGEFAPPRGRPVKYPIGYLRVGESIFFPGVTHRQINNCRPIHRPKRFKVRTKVWNGVVGVRVWRIE